MFNAKTYVEARMVAEKVHANQTYDKIFPYMKHVDDVVAVLNRFGYSGKFRIAGFLHDSMEDGDLSYKDIKTRFGEDIAEIVFCVTDELGRTRKEKKEKTLPKTASNPDSIIVKLADRIANMEHGGKAGMYQKEHSEFRKALYRPDHSEAMWTYLEGLIFRDN